MTLGNGLSFMTTRMTTRFRLLLRVLLAGSFGLALAAAQTVGPISITSNQCARIGALSGATVAVNVSGTWTGSLQPQGTIQGQTAFNVQVVPSSGLAAQGSISANGAFVAAVSGYTSFQLCGATIASGTATVYLTLSPALSSGISSAASNGQQLVPTQVVQSGLLAEYRMLPTETPAGLLDYSGNGNNATGTVGVAPTIIAGTGGVNFVGTGAIALPAGVNSAQTIQFVAQFQYAGAAQYNGFISAAPGTTVSCPMLLLDNQHGVINLSTNYDFETWNTNFRASKRYTLQGEGIVTWEINTSGNDLIQLNNSGLVTFGPFQGTLASNNYQLGGATGGGGVCPAVAHYYVGQIYYAVFYNRMLTQAEVSLNNTFLSSVMATRGLPIALASTSTTDAITLDGDSEIGFVTTGMTTFPTPLNVYNLSAPGFTTAQIAADAPYAIDPFIQPVNNRQLDLVWVGTNDAGGSAQTVLNRLNGYCRARHQLGWACGVVDVMDISGADAFKNSYDGLLRQFWPTFADFFVDVGADPNLGCDGCSANTTFMVSGLHPTVASANNILAPYIQRGINRYYGNKDWTSATTYASAAPAATAITAASESTNTVTITSTLNPPVNSCVVVAGVTPAGYNNTSGECWNVLTTSATNFTYFNFVSGLGVGTVFGTAAMPLQKDADMYTILNFGAGSFTLEPCGGYTGQKIYIKNVNAVSSTITAFGNDLIDGSATATVAQNAVLVLQAKLATPSTPVCSWVKVQNN